MKSFQKIVAEAKTPYVIYHDTYTSAVDEVERYMKKRGYVMDQDEMTQTIGFGPKKPSAGKTNSFSMKLYKSQKDIDNDKPQKKYVHFQVYGMGSRNHMGNDKYELNCYIS